MAARPEVGASARALVAALRAAGVNGLSQEAARSIAGGRATLPGRTQLSLVLLVCAGFVGIGTDGRYRLVPMVSSALQAEASRAREVRA